MKARLIYLVLGIALAVAAVLGFGVFGAEATVVDVLYGKGDFEGQNYSDWSFVNISNTTGFQDSAYTSSGTGSAGLSVSGGEAAGYSYYSIPFTMPDGDSLITATVTGSFLKRTKDSSNAQKWIVSWEVYNSTGSSKISGGTIDTFIGDVAWKSFSHAITGLKFRERYVLRLSTRCVNSVGLNLQSYTNWDDIRLVVESELDSTAPTTAMSSPVPDSTVAGTVYLKATAADTGGSGVNRVDFEYADNSSFTGAVLLSGAVFQEGKWVMPWQTSAFNGTFWIRSRAHDGRGNYSYSTAVKYTLDNTPPTLSLSYFSDSAFSRPLKMSGGKLSAGTGDIYIRLDANEALRKLVEDNQISIDAPGTANDVTWPANFSWTGSAWCYKWHVVQDTDGDTLSIRVKGTDLLGNVRTLTSPESGGVVRLDTTPPICKLEYYSDPDLKQVLVTRDNIPVTRAGTVYVKLVPNETLRNQIGDNKLYIDAPGVVNDVKDGGFSWTGTAWRYTWNVNRGNSGLTASIRVQGTDVLGNVVSGIPAEGQQLRVDNIGPEVKLEYYSDPGLSPDSRLPLLNGQFFTASGSVWVKLISNKELKDGPGDNSVTIDAPGTDNDVNDGEFVRLGSDFVYRWDIRDSLDDKHSNDGQVQGVHIKATDYLGNITEYSPETDRVTIVNKGPEIKLHYFTDPGCTNPVPRTSDGRPILRAGLNYIRLDSNQPLTAIATDLLISIDAPKGVSNGNDVQDQPFTWVEDGKFWRYTYQVPAQGMDSNGPAEVAVQAVNWVGLGSTGKPLEGSLAEIYTTSAPATMTITGNKTYLASDNSASLSITVHLDNENGTHTGCEGRPVILASNFGEVSPSTALSDPDGNAIFTFRTAVGGTAKFSATVAGFPQLKGSFQVLCGPADYDPPVLIKAEAAGKQLVYLTFNEPLKSLETSNFILKQGSDTVSTMAYLVGDGRVVRLMVLDGVSLGTGNQFPAPLTYTVTAENVPDLADNKTDSSVISFESYTPHGKYAPQTFTSGNSTRMCGQCHSAHESTGARLLNRTTITKVCFVCHGILGVSEYRVEGEFTSRYGDGSLLSATLHKSLDGGYPGFEVLYCTDCHNPHGDRIPGQGNTIYPKLLKATVNGVVYNQGNDFCLACHGAVDKGFAGDPGYFSALGGNHSQVSAVHYNLEIAPDPLGQGALSPLSGTRVTCVRCHERHGSQFGKLLDNSRTGPEEDQCYKCHGRDASDKDQNYSMTVGTNVYNTFQTSVSIHQVDNEDRGKVECSSCHGPHSVSNVKHNAGQAASAISDPFNTKNTYTSASGSLSEFCLKCHGDLLPVAGVSADSVVPYTISFVDQGFTTNGGGWNKAAPMSYLDSGHYNNASLKVFGNRDNYGNPRNDCTVCHDWHGTGYEWLVKLGEDSFGSDGICLQCHQSDLLEKPGSVKSLNVKQDLTSGSAHPTIRSGFDGRHSNTEDNYRQAQTGSNRHAQCYDCHDPHTVKGSVGQIDKLGNISGVKFNWGSTGWADWNDQQPGAIPVFLDPESNNVQAYLCFKCHSKYAYGLEIWQDGSGASDLRAPHKNPSTNGKDFNQTDLARDFNPNNKSKHIVIPGYPDTSSDINIANGYGSFTGSWESGALALSRNSVLKCTDCHASATGAMGPHGSTNAFILVAPWIPEGSARTGLVGTQDHLCFKCHSYSTYVQGGEGNSQFRFEGNLHLGHNAQGCAKCHGGLPHGWWRTNANGHGLPLTLRSDPAPYGTGSGFLELDTTTTEGGGNPWGFHGEGYTCKTTAWD